jgi:hypothetical protein
VCCEDADDEVRCPIMADSGGAGDVHRGDVHGGGGWLCLVS